MITEQGIYQIVFYLFVLLILVKPLGWYMNQVYDGKISGSIWILGFFERLLYKLCGIQVTKEMDWKSYLSSMLVFNCIGFLAVYMILRLQIYLPLNPQHFLAPTPDLAFNTAASFVTNTDWQSYSGETTMSYLAQMLALTTQNFLSAATGMSLLIALIRGVARHEVSSLGNFWVDLVRGVLYILLPLSFIFALIFVSQGVIQNLQPNQKVTVLQSLSVPSEQVIPMGPVASQLAIKQLGTNGGGFFNANSAHPFENPTPLTNFLEMLAILLIPASFTYTFGMMVRDRRQGWALLIAMCLIFLLAVVVTISAEQVGNPLLTAMGTDPIATAQSYPAGNMEGKETRFGIVNSALWAVITTATSNGSMNAMLDSFTPIGGLVPLWMMHLGEVIFGGVGSGLYGMLMLVIITVFIVGLMVGRTPEYLGKKIEPYEMKMAAIAVLIMPLAVMFATALGCVTPAGVSSIANPGAHGFSEIFYAFSSMGNNNGSSFAGLNANTPFYNLLGGFMMLLARYWIAISALAIAGSLARKKRISVSSGTLETHTPLFIVLLIAIVLLLSALAFLPALALGPIVEQLMLGGNHGY